MEDRRGHTGPSTQSINLNSMWASRSERVRGRGLTAHIKIGWSWISSPRPVDGHTLVLALVRLLTVLYLKSSWGAQSRDLQRSSSLKELNVQHTQMKSFLFKRLMGWRTTCQFEGNVRWSLPGMVSFIHSLGKWNMILTVKRCWAKSMTCSINTFMCVSVIIDFSDRHHAVLQQ